MSEYGMIQSQERLQFPKCKVCVLMSTYNGARFLNDQIESLLNQDYEETSILVRDDGSKDDTTRILEEYSCQGKLTWYQGENLGPARSFLNLLRNSPEADYYAFCDQDDVWLTDKLSSAIEKLDARETCMKCYFSSYRAVDVQLNPIDMPLQPFIPQRLSAAIVKNSATGCTMVISKALRKALNAYEPKCIDMHDWWAYLVCLSLDGDVVYDSQPHILYRQHGNNVVGVDSGLARRVRRRLLQRGKLAVRRSEHARELLAGYSERMHAETRSLLESLANYNRNAWSRIRFAIGNEFHCGIVATDILFRWDALTGRL